MKVVVSVFGRFHLFDLSRQLEKKNALSQIITSYPKWKVSEWEINKKNVKAFFVLELVKRALSRAKLANKRTEEVLKRTFGRYVSKAIADDVDAFIFFAGNGWQSELASKLQDKNVICIADEGSAHVREHQKILSDEYELLGLKSTRVNSVPLISETLREYEQADFIVVPSTFVKRTMVENGVVANKIFVNPYGVDLSSFKQVEKKDNVFRVIYCGNLSIQKGSHYLLKAVHELDLQDFELWHIGGISSEMTPYIQQYKSTKIVYKGRYPQARLHTLYSQGNVFCIPSIQDGFAMVILQAMACGLPIICSENTGGVDLISEDGREGFVIPIRNSEAIKDKIRFLYANREVCAQMGAHAKSRVAEGFTWDDYGDRYYEFLEKIRNK